MGNFIVVTSINQPSEAVKKFAKIKNWEFIVVGDKKTPIDWKMKNTKYITVNEQKKTNNKFIKLIPWNHYSRKMIGYLYAINHGADLIADSDDDNIPLHNWGNITEPKKCITGSKWVNSYYFYSNKKIWPRGYPLDQICRSNKWRIVKQKSKIGIWQFMADINPDLDAICRLLGNEDVKFNGDFAASLDFGSYTPINSQNTFFKKELFPLLYLPTTVSFRFTDILRGFVAQPLMWKMGYKVGIASCTVRQKRNTHDLMKDFAQEVQMYTQTNEIIDILENTNLKNSVYDNIRICYKALSKKGVVDKTELDILDEWIKNLTATKQ